MLGSTQLVERLSKGPGSRCNSTDTGSNLAAALELGKNLAVLSGDSDISSRHRNVAKKNYFAHSVSIDHLSPQAAQRGILF